MTTENIQGFRKSSLTGIDRAAQALAWLSIGLGAAEILFPGTISRTLGLQNKNALLRAFGAREIAAGIGALQPNAAPAIWARVGGDMMDLATLATARGQDNERRGAVAAAMMTVAAITVVDIAVAALLSNQKARTAPPRDYSDRTGFPNGLGAAHGAATKYRTTPPDMRAAPAPAIGVSHDPCLLLARHHR